MEWVKQRCLVLQRAFRDLGERGLVTESQLRALGHEEAANVVARAVKGKQTTTV